MTAKSGLVLLALTIGSLALPANALDDLLEQGSDSRPYEEPLDDSIEHYRQQIKGVDFTTFLFSPSLRGTRTDHMDGRPFWERTDAQMPGFGFIGRSLLAVPRHLLWDTPVAFGKNLKLNYVDTWSESRSGVHIAQDMVFGIPNSAMVLFNGVFDTADTLVTDVAIPVVIHAVGWPIRFLTGLTEPLGPVYTVVDAPSKLVWGMMLPIRKFNIIVQDQAQKGTNFLYKTIHDPDEIKDFAILYWGNGKSSTHPAPGEIAER
jgi:hypothetical protein